MTPEENQSILKRIKVRLTGDTISDDMLNEYIQTLDDRICLRLNTDSTPKVFYSIIVDASVKMYRRLWYEGESSESDDGVSASFVEDVLSEYNAEFAQYIDNQRQRSKVVQFI